jgi:D-threo-aldose 1-dehydrogenase
MRSPAEVERNIALAARPVPKELWAELVAEGLLRPDAPVPVQAPGEAE